MTGPLVTIIIPTRGKAGLLRNCLKGLCKFAFVTPGSVEIVVMEQAVDGVDACRDMIEKEFAEHPIEWKRSGDGWSFSEINNAGAEGRSAPYLLLLNNDTVPRQRFLSEMLKLMEDEKVVIVSAKLLHPNRTIQHVGVIFRSDGVPYHIGWGRPDDGTFGPAERDDEYDAVTFACVLIRRSVWDEIGGLDSAYFFNYEDIDFCLKARERGWKIKVAHRAVVIHLESQSAEARQTDKHSVGRNLKIFLERWVDTGKVNPTGKMRQNSRLERATGLRLLNDVGTFRSHLLNVAFVPSSRGSGVPWWRIEQPARMLGKLGLANVETIYVDQPDERIMKALELADVVVYNGFWSDWLWRIAALRERRHFAMVYDYDDHPLSISPWSEAYRTFGTQEIRLKETDTYLWRDGEHGFDVERNRENRQRQIEIFHLVDLMTTTTVPLHQYFKTLNPHVAVLPNAIDFSMFRSPFDLWDRRQGPPRIGWHGGDNHIHDVQTVAPWLVEFVNSHDVRLVIFGSYYRAPFAGIDQAKVIEEEWVHVEAFPWKLQTLGIDVAVIPLADPSLPGLLSNEHKSDLKYLEYSALKVPSLVAAGRTAYGACVDGENSLTYATREEFIEKLASLCRDVDLRRRIGSAAYDWVREYRDMEKLASRWLLAYEEVSERFQASRQKQDENLVSFPPPKAGALAEADAIDATVPESDLSPAASNAAAEGTQ